MKRITLLKKISIPICFSLIFIFFYVFVIKGNVLLNATVFSQTSLPYCGSLANPSSQYVCNSGSSYHLCYDFNDSQYSAYGIYVSNQCTGSGQCAPPPAGFYQNTWAGGQCCAKVVNSPLGKTCATIDYYDQSDDLPINCGFIDSGATTRCTDYNSLAIYPHLAWASYCSGDTNATCTGSNSSQCSSETGYGLYSSGVSSYCWNAYYYYTNYQEYYYQRIPTITGGSIYNNSTNQYVASGSTQMFNNRITDSVSLNTWSGVTSTSWKEVITDNIDNKSSTYYGSGGSFTYTLNSGSISNPTPNETFHYYVTFTEYYNGGSQSWSSSLSAVNPPPKPVISSISIYDNSLSRGLNSGDTGLYSDSITASPSINTTYITRDWKENVTASGGGNTTIDLGSSSNITFNLNAIVGTPSPGEKYTFNITLNVNNTSGSASSSFTLYMYIPVNFSFSCQSNAESLLAASNPLIEYDNSPTNPCSNWSVLANNYIKTSGSNYNSSFEASNRDSIVYFPGTDNVAMLTGAGSNNIWIVKWQFENSSLQNIVNPSTVQVAILVNNTTTPTDLTISYASNQPNSLFVSQYSQNSSILNIPWNVISADENSFLNNVPFSPINANNYIFYRYNKSLYANGIIADGNNLYWGMIDRTTNTNYIYEFNIQNGSITQKWDLGSTGTSQTGVLQNGKRVRFLNSWWSVDGLSVSPDGKYVFAVSQQGILIWVIQNAQGTSPSMLGYAPVLTGTTDLSKESGLQGLDGIAVDPNGQIYFVLYNQGIYSTSETQLINAASENGNSFLQYGTNIYIYANATVNAQAFITGNFDDIAPLSFPGAPTITPAKWMNTMGANVFSQYGYGSLQNPLNLNFSEYGLFDNTNKVNKYASLYNWQFSSYTSMDNSINGSITPVYGYSYLMDDICNNSGKNKCNTVSTSSLPSNTINGSVALNGVNILNGNITIDASSGGIQTTGILFINGNLTITPDSSNTFFSNSQDRLLVIVSGNININPNSYYCSGTNCNSNLYYQYINLGLVSNGSITVNPYVNNLSFPNYMEPLVISGVGIFYGGITQKLDIGNLDLYDPAVKFNYDPTLILQNENFFTDSQLVSQQLGL